MSTPSLNILIMSDFHYACSDDPLTIVGNKRYTSLGALLVRKALLRLRHMGEIVDLILLPGDLLNDGTTEDAEAALTSFMTEVHAHGIPVLTVPGNHDLDAKQFTRITGCAPGLHIIRGYGFILFHDLIADGDITTRREADLELVSDLARLNPDLPLIAVQHNPIFPAIESTGYPYMPTNTARIKKSLADAKVTLSISGHYHNGQSLQKDGGVGYYTAKAACESPFNFALLRLTGDTASIEEISLRHEEPDLIDIHCHTAFAYCAEDVSVEWDAALTKLLGLSRLYITEHAFHLYFNKADAWSYRWQREPEMVDAAFASPRERMAAYRRMLAEVRDPFIRAGLEVDLCANGELLLAEEDSLEWDILVGAVHAVPDKVTTQTEAETAFMNATASILEKPIQVLAHPFRWFQRNGFDLPPHLYPPVAKLLAAAGVAAEINYHTNSPDPRFLEECLKQQVKLVLGSDSHNKAEVGEFFPHLKLLQRLGAQASDIFT